MATVVYQPLAGAGYPLPWLKDWSAPHLEQLQGVSPSAAMRSSSNAASGQSQGQQLSQSRHTSSSSSPPYTYTNSSGSYTLVAPTRRTLEALAQQQEESKLQQDEQRLAREREDERERERERKSQELQERRRQELRERLGLKQAANDTARLPAQAWQFSLSADWDAQPGGTDSAATSPKPSPLRSPRVPSHSNWHSPSRSPSGFAGPAGAAAWIKKSPRTAARRSPLGKSLVLAESYNDDLSEERSRLELGDIVAGPSSRWSSCSYYSFPGAGIASAVSQVVSSWAAPFGGVLSGLAGRRAGTAPAADEVDARSLADASALETKLRASAEAALEKAKPPLPPPPKPKPKPLAPAAAATAAAPTPAAAPPTPPKPLITTSAEAPRPAMTQSPATAADPAPSFVGSFSLPKSAAAAAAAAAAVAVPSPFPASSSSSSSSPSWVLVPPKAEGGGLATAPTSAVSAGDLKQWLEELNEAEKTVTSFRGDASQKQFRLDAKKMLNTRIGQISATAKSIRSSTSDLLQFLSRSLEGADDAKRIYLEYSVAERFYDEAKVGVAAQPRSAWCKAHTLARICEHYPNVLKRVRALLLRDCPYAFGDFAGSEAGRATFAPGQQTKEPFTGFADRMGACLRLWVALLVVQGDLGLVWSWVAKVLNSSQATPVMAPLLQVVLETSGRDMQARYKHQFIKLATIAEAHFLPSLHSLEARCRGEEVEQLKASSAKLQLWLKILRSNGQPPLCEGRFIEADQEAALNPDI